MACCLAIVAAVLQRLRHLEAALADELAADLATLVSRNSYLQARSQCSMPSAAGIAASGHDKLLSCFGARHAETTCCLFVSRSTARDRR
jgi:hypothetical protein